ncbi:MAG TPA: YdeI/OmpD-associated family protein [Allosphingosinicella sp.]|nr:YdeI/OmpD-associated family protein [Allosphingosinicella sp.]
MPEEEGETRGGLPILLFADQAALAEWLERQPRDHKGIWLKLAKKGSPVGSVSQREAVEAGLCFGWIDGLMNPYDESFYLIRFTPRRPRSKWSQINVERAEALIEAGRMRPGGLAEVEAAKADGRWADAYPPHSRAEPPPDLRAALDSSPRAAAFFATLRGANRYGLIYRVLDAKKPDTRAKRIAGYIAMLERGETLF